MGGGGILGKFSLLILKRGGAARAVEPSSPKERAAAARASYRKYVAGGRGAHNMHKIW